MKKNFLLSLILFSIGIPAFSQTTATNFTASDCDGVSHDLFTELDAGKVVVMVWVMPCATCLGPALAAHSAVQSYSVDHPGKVLFYLVDDFANTPCSTLKGWAFNNGMIGKDIFSDPAIDMANYGIYGMPKVVVLGGGSSHKIFYNNNYSAEGVGEAINEALGATATAEGVSTDLDIKFFPNPARDVINVSYNLTQSSSLRLDIINASGVAEKSVVVGGKQAAGLHEMQVDTKLLANGVYFLRLQTDLGSQVVKFHVSR